MEDLVPTSSCHPQHKLPAPLTDLGALELNCPCSCGMPHPSLSEANSSPTAQTAARFLVFRKAFLKDKRKTKQK